MIAVRTYPGRQDKSSDIKRCFYADKIDNVDLWVLLLHRARWTAAPVNIVVSPSCDPHIAELVAPIHTLCGRGMWSAIGTLESKISHVAP